MKEPKMRTNIVIDDQLMTDVMATGEFKTKREAVEAGLRLLALRKTYQGLRALRGQLQWEDGTASATTATEKLPSERVAEANA
jgi:Arc/MetJ family transcription regulator